MTGGTMAMDAPTARTVEMFGYRRFVSLAVFQFRGVFRTWREKSGAFPALQQEIAEAVQRRVDSLPSAEDRTALHAADTVVTAVASADAIGDYPQHHAIDVIVMGTHGRGVLARAFMGSVAERVVRTATCPVLTVHQPQHECIVPDSLVPFAVTRGL
jgi:nucleotide-binding universal stress UspA family protein